MTTWRFPRGPAVVLAGVALLAAGAWWGIVRGSDDSASGGAPGDAEASVMDLHNALDLVPGCRRDVCQVEASRSGFRFDGDPATLVVVSKPGECGGLSRSSVHLVGPDGIVWSGPGDLVCGDPIGGIETDPTGHAFLAFPSGADSAWLIVLDVDDGRVADFGSFDGRFTGDGVVARDVDGDRVKELVVSRDDCDPDCATGTETEVVYRWTGTRYAESGP